MVVVTHQRRRNVVYFPLLDVWRGAAADPDSGLCVLELRQEAGQDGGTERDHGAGMEYHGQEHRSSAKAVF